MKHLFYDFQRNNYFEDSIIERIYDALVNFETVTNAVASMLYETSVDWLQIEGLMRYLEDDKGTELVRKRMLHASLYKSLFNMGIMDTSEDIKRYTQTFNTLPDIIEKFAGIISAASGIPATKFMGESPGGLNATGISDLENYYTYVQSLQEDDFNPNLDIIDKLMIKNLGIEVNEDNDELSYEWVNLFYMSDQQQAELEHKRAERDQIYLDQDIVTPEIVAGELMENNTYTNIDATHIKKLKEFGELEEESMRNALEQDGDPDPDDSDPNNNDDPDEKEDT